MINNESLALHLLNLIKLAKGESNENQFIDFEIRHEIVSEIEKQLSICLIDYKFRIDVYAIRHIFKQHGNDIKEKMRGQIVVTETDISLILDILENSKTVLYDGKSRNNKDIFVFEKQLKNIYIVIVEIRIGKKRIALHSMRILKTKKNQN